MVVLAVILVVVVVIVDLVKFRQIPNQAGFIKLGCLRKQKILFFLYK